jgi:UDP-N-acetylmuramate: L-alanyl-gamma-D-glutamyl-meso-diaminopimelate ligase
VSTGPLLGEHNQLNALAAIAAAEHVGVAPDAGCRALASFANVRRRLELRGEVRGVGCTTTLRTTPRPCAPRWNGLRRKLGPRGQPEPRILAVFEPRSNTMKLGTMKAQLPWALEEADLSLCLQGNYGWNATRGAGAAGRHSRGGRHRRRAGGRHRARPPAPATTSCA